VSAACEWAEWAEDAVKGIPIQETLFGDTEITEAMD
jgi:hypothetical protein